MTRNRTKGYVGQVLDGAKLATIANAIYTLQYTEPSVCKVDNELLLIKLEETDVWGDPKFAILCSEGVGWIQDQYRTIEVPTNIGAGGLWNGRVHISIEMIQTCLTDKTADLSEFVRTFGSRLDSNCDLWQSKMATPSDSYDSGTENKNEHRVQNA